MKNYYRNSKLHASFFKLVNYNVSHGGLAKNQLSLLHLCVDSLPIKYSSEFSVIYFSLFYYFMNILS